MDFCTAWLSKRCPPTIIALPRIMAKPCSHWFPHSQTKSSNETIPKSQTSSAPKLAIPSTQLVLKTLDFSSLHGLLHSKAQQAAPPYNNSSTQNSGQALQPLAHKFPNPKLQTIPKSQTSPAPKLAIPSTQLVLKTLDFSSLHGLLHSMAQQAVPPYNNSITQKNSQALQPLAPKLPNPKL